MTRTPTRISDLQLAVEQIRAVLVGENDLIANLANVSAILAQNGRYWWTGFYLVKDEELVLGPFQGPVACTRIARGKGVCGTAWAEERTVVVPDVHDFPGHIACSAESKSEVVIPIILEGEVRMVLDIDSRSADDFPQEEVALLEAAMETLTEHLSA